ncbi:MAG: hypothetical protein ACW986_16545 [Promethearchaeota archaeon]
MFKQTRVFALWFAGIILVVYLGSYVITLSFKRRLLRRIQEYPTISDIQIAEKLDYSIEYIRNMLSSLSKNQKRKNWLIVNLNERYIFFNEHTVEIFKDLHRRGYTEKKILENLQQEMSIRSRAIVKAMEITLANQNRLDN